MEDEDSPLKTFFERAEEYGKIKVELYKLKAIKKTAEVTSSAASGLVISVLIALFFLIVNIGIALWLGEVFGKSYYGFFIVSGFYAILGVLVYIFRDQWIKTPISNSIAEHALK
jgi:hypothetical protein